MRAIYVVTKCEYGSEVALARLANIVMVVMEFCSSIKWNKLGWVEWEVEPRHIHMHA